LLILFHSLAGNLVVQKEFFINMCLDQLFLSLPPVLAHHIGGGGATEAHQSDKQKQRRRLVCRLLCKLLGEKYGCDWMFREEDFFTDETPAAGGGEPDDNKTGVMTATPPTALFDDYRFTERQSATLSINEAAFIETREMFLEAFGQLSSSSPAFYISSFLQYEFCYYIIKYFKT
jgi:hypothetical protein